MKDVKLIIFDYDGTVVQTFDVFKKSLRALVKKLGLKGFSEEDFEYMAKHTPKTWLPMILSKFPPNKRPNPETILEIFTRTYSETNLKSIKAVPGVYKVLEELRRKGYILVLTTGRVLVSKFVLNELKHLNLDKYFDMIYIPNSPNKLKTVKEIMKKFNVKNAVIIGDSVDDIRAGKVFNLKTIAVLYGFSSKDELVKYKPDYVVEEVEDILAIV